MTKSAVSCGFGHIYWRNSSWKTSQFVQCNSLLFRFLDMKFDTKVHYRKYRDREHWLLGVVRLIPLAATFLVFMKKDKYSERMNASNPVLVTWFLKLSVVIKWFLLWTITLEFDARVLWNDSVSQLFQCFNAFYDSIYCTILNILTLFRTRGGGAKSHPPNQFFPCNFYKRRNNPPKFLTFSFDPSATLMQNFQAISGASPKLLNLN